MSTTTTLFNRTARELMDRGRAPFFGPELFGIPTFYLWNLLVVLIIALIFYWLLRSSRIHETPMDVLKKRYVRGEIDKETFEAMKKDITD